MADQAIRIHGIGRALRTTGCTCCRCIAARTNGSTRCTCAMPDCTGYRKEPRG